MTSAKPAPLNRLRQLWREGRPTFGAIATIPSIQTVQIMARSRDRLDHRRSRARPDRSRLGACDDHGHRRHALRADGADCRQRAVAGQSADGPRRARHQLSDDLQPRGRRKGRAQRALSAEGRPAVGPVPRAVPLGRVDAGLHGDRRRRHDLHDHHRACRGGRAHRRDHGDTRHRPRGDRPRRPRHLHQQARPARRSRKCWR